MAALLASKTVPSTESNQLNENGPIRGLSHTKKLSEKQCGQVTSGNDDGDADIPQAVFALVGTWLPRIFNLMG